MRKPVSESEIDAMLARMSSKRADKCPPVEADKTNCIECVRLRVRIAELEARLVPKVVKDAVYWREQKRKQRARKLGG